MSISHDSLLSDSLSLPSLLSLRRLLLTSRSCSFLTQLGHASLKRMEELIAKHFTKGGSLTQLLRPPKRPGENFELFEGFWLERGDQKVPTAPVSRFLCLPLFASGFLLCGQR